MQVAITGVEDVGHGQTVFIRQCAYAQQHLGQALAWNGAVHAVIIG